MKPQGAIGCKLYTTERSTLEPGGGAGAVWQKNPSRNPAVAGTLNADRSLTLRLSGGASLKQVLDGLWKTEHFEDALYRFGAALVTSITRRAELEVEFPDDLENVTRNPAVEKNDTAFVTSFLFKFRSERRFRRIFGARRRRRARAVAHACRSAGAARG